MVNLDFFGYVDQLLLGNNHLNKLNVFKTYSRIQTQVPYAMIISCHYLFLNNYCFMICFISVRRCNLNYFTPSSTYVVQQQEVCYSQVMSSLLTCFLK